MLTCCVWTVGTAEWEAELRAELSEFSDLGAKPEHES